MAARMSFRSFIQFHLVLVLLLSCNGYAKTPDLTNVFSSKHTNNWAVIVCTSRFWFNYRHVANSLAIYRSVKRLGIPDSHIILMLADDMACNARNPRPGTVFSNSNQETNVYGDDVEVDYRGYEVTVENFIRVITGRLPSSVPRSKRLLSDDRSNILVYMTGHGGDGFLKFQDAEEISSIELADAFEQMWQKQRYHEIFFMVDTCQAQSMQLQFYSPNILAVGSSKIGEDSLSHHSDSDIGVYVVDRYTYYVLQFLERVEANTKATIGELFQYTTPSLVRSTPSTRTDLFPRDVHKVNSAGYPELEELIRLREKHYSTARYMLNRNIVVLEYWNVVVTDFFGSVRNIELSNETKIIFASSGDTTSKVRSDSPVEQRQLRSLSEFPVHKEIVQERYAFKLSNTFYGVFTFLVSVVSVSWILL